MAGAGRRARQAQAAARGLPPGWRAFGRSDSGIPGLLLARGRVRGGTLGGHDRSARSAGESSGRSPTSPGCRASPACPTPRTRPTSPASTWRSSGRRPTRGSPTGPGPGSAPRAIRADNSPRPAPGGRRRRVRGAARGRLRRRPVLPATPPHPRHERAHGRRDPRSRRDPGRPRRRPRHRRSRHPPWRAPGPGWGWSSSTPTPTPAPSLRVRSPTARRCGAWSRRAGRSSPLPPERPPRLLARAGGIRLAGRAGISPLHARRAGAGLRQVVDARAGVGPGPAILAVDIDVLDPAFAPGTGTPEPGGMTTAELLVAVRLISAVSSWSGPRWSRSPDRPRLGRHHRPGRGPGRPGGALRDCPAPPLGDDRQHLGRVLADEAGADAGIASSRARRRAGRGDRRQGRLLATVKAGLPSAARRRQAFSSSKSGASAAARARARGARRTPARAGWRHRDRLRVGQPVRRVADVAAALQRRAGASRSPKWSSSARRRQRSRVDEGLDRAVVAPAALVGDRQLRVACALFVEADQAAEVGAHRQQHRLRRQPVAPRAAGLLVVGLEAGRDRHVPDRAHVGLVDAHPEGVGGDDHVDLARHEAALDRGPLLRLHPGVVGAGAHARLAQRLGDLVGVLAGAAVDDRRAVRRVGEPASSSASRRAFEPFPSSRTTSKERLGRSKPERTCERVAHAEAGDDLRRHRARSPSPCRPSPSAARAARRSRGRRR